jgi:hypothetical protein
MSSVHQAAVTANLQDPLDNQKAAPEQKIDINNPLHPLHVSNRDLRIVPDGWTPADADPNDILSHYDLRLKPVDSELGDVPR